VKKKRFRATRRPVKKSPPLPWRRPGVPDLLLGALALVLMASTLGLLSNHRSPQPLTLLKPWSPPLPERVSEVSLEQARHLQQEGAFFLDAREKVRYEDGHVPGAMNLSPEEFADMGQGRMRRNLLATLQVTPAVVVYCDGPVCQSSQRLAEALAKAGLSNVRIMREGWPAWEAEGLPTVRIP
jgi:rhodanese-related sulfurtransferase